MESKQKKTIKDVKEWDIVVYLAKLGIEPVKIREHNFWYFSPFRIERTPSFKVNRNINRWYDFGEGIGGTLIDFGIRFNSCTVGEFMELVANDELPINSIKFKVNHSTATQSKIEIIKITPIFSGALLSYLSKRGISITLADQFLKEITYTNNCRQYYAIGFKNDKEGWELRSAHFKGSSAPKFLTHIDNNFTAIAVFEGFLDFLSFLQLTSGSGGSPKNDYLILNSLSFVQKAIEILRDYEGVSLFLDNDKAGDDHTLIFQSDLEQAEDKRGLYKNVKDLNDFLCFGRKAVENLPKKIIGRGKTL